MRTFLRATIAGLLACAATYTYLYLGKLHESNDRQDTGTTTLRPDLQPAKAPSLNVLLPAKAAPSSNVLLPAKAAQSSNVPRQPPRTESLPTAQPLPHSQRQTEHLILNITAYRLQRQARFRNRTEFLTYYNTLFEKDKRGKGMQWRPNADKDGPILDFAIIGFAKCGTTSMEANLGELAPMPVADICTPLAQTAHYANVGWVDKFDPGGERPLRGTKCPQYIHGLDGWQLDALPRMKLIVGIRHPITWFMSHWNMLARNTGTGIRRDSLVYERQYWQECRKGCHFGCLSCRGGSCVCMQRGKFHLWLAKMGKTSLTDPELQLLAPQDADGGYEKRSTVATHRLKNPVFLYAQTELRERYVWNELAEYLEVPYVPSTREMTSINKSTRNGIDICEDKFNAFRAKFMPIAYNMSRWLIEYLLPVARDKTRPDVVIPGVDRFEKVVADYREDPCGKLTRLQGSGTYVMKSGEPLHWPTDEEVLAESEAIRHPKK